MNATSGCPLNVCHVATMTRLGGVERMMVDFLTHVSQSHIRHSLITTSSIPGLLDPILDAGISTFQPTRRFHYDPSAVFQMAHWLRAERVQVVHSYNAFANAWGHLAAQAAGISVYIAGERGTIWSTNSFPVRWLDRLAQRRANAVVANSAASATMVHLRHGVPHDRIHIVHNAVSPLPTTDVAMLRAELGLPGGVPVVGSIGRLDTPKGFHVFVEAAALVLNKRPDTRFILIGGGPLASELGQQVRTLGISDRFLLSGWRDDARELIQAFDVFVSTSIREPFGNVLVEAGLAGIPSIAPRIDGIPEIIIDGVNGILLSPTEPIRQPELGQRAPHRVLVDGKLVPPREISARVLAETILGLLADSSLCSSYGQAARDRAKALFSMDRYIAEVEAIYTQTTTEAEPCVAVDRPYS